VKAGTIKALFALTLVGAAVLIFPAGHFGSLNRQSQEANNLERRIHRVESGLVPLDAAKGEALTPKNVIERMRHYKVPGVSVAVIDNETIAWARGYGVANVATGQSVDVDTGSKQHLSANLSPRWRRCIL
jgi:CubicO group peptidase (beta-lactamase class C family)